MGVTYDWLDTHHAGNLINHPKIDIVLDTCDSRVCRDQVAGHGIKLRMSSFPKYNATSTTNIEGAIISGMLARMRPALCHMCHV